MANYQVQCERIKNGQTSKATSYISVQANSESEARSIAREKAKMQYPDCRISIGTAKRIS